MCFSRFTAERYETLYPDVWALFTAFSKEMFLSLCVKNKEPSFNKTFWKQIRAHSIDSIPE